MRGDLAGIGDEAGSSLSEQIAATRTLNWRHLELRAVDGLPLAELSRPQFAEAAGQLRRARLDVVCVCSRIGNWARPVTADFADDVAELRVLAERCTELGTRYVRIMSYPNDGLGEAEWRRRVVERVQRLADQAERADVVLLHENCSGWAGTDAGRALDLLEAVGSPALRLLFDTGNGVAHGYPALDLLAELAPHVAHVHVKDAVLTDGQARYVLPGDGEAGVADCLRLLLAGGYRGAFSIEPHLSAVPHQGRAAGEGAAARFVEAGRRLEHLLHRLPATATR